MPDMAQVRPSDEHRICARCGDRALARHHCRTFSPSRAAAVADLELPADATLADFERLVAGAPFEVACVLGCLPPRRRERLWEQLAHDADEAHERRAA